MPELRPYYIAGKWKYSDEKLEVINPANGQTVSNTSYATRADVEEAISAAERAFQDTRRLSSHERFDILMKIYNGMEKRKDELIRLIVQEAGKPIRDATAEFQRGLLTVQTAAEEAKRIGGESMPLDWTPAADRRFGITKRFPIGPILGISPFNFPLNLALHKLAPALAAGNPIVLKPATKTPLVMLAMAEIIHQAGLPEGAVSIFPVPNEVAEQMVKDDRFKLLTFTGSSPVGWHLKSVAGQKNVLLELGGNAGVIVDDTAPLEYTLQRVLTGGFSYSGQSCISVQRVYVHQSIYDKFSEGLVDGARNLKIGDTMDPDTDMGPMIDEKAAQRIQQWVQEAVDGGSRLLVGGERKGAFFSPAVLSGAPPDSRVCTQEAFAPIIVLFPFDNFAGALRALDRSYFGLQSGVFTRDLEHAWMAFEELTVGGIMLNDVPTWRVDHMPYGGVKGSGLGREGIRYSIEEMTELKLMVINRAWVE